MELHVDDDGFVRAPVDLVYRRLTDVASWPTWWPGVRLHALPGGGADGERWAVEWATSRVTALRCVATVHGWRHDAGFSLALQGDLAGRAEFWLEPVRGGTVVHHLLVATTPRRAPLRVHRAYRRAVRRGLWGFKDRLHLEVRTAVGLAP